MRVEPCEAQQASSLNQALGKFAANLGATPFEPGVSVIVCCHNSAHRLPTTLEHLRNQRVEGFPWEVILVDNGSTDNTARLAEEQWLPQEAPVGLIIVNEPKLGLSFAPATRYQGSPVRLAELRGRR